MIVRMTKVEIAGPKELLFETIEAARRLGVLHLESDPQSAAGHDSLPLNSLQLPEKEIEERIFYEELADTIFRLLELLPTVKLRQTYLQPLPVIDIVAAKAPIHLQHCQQLRDQLTGLSDEEKGLDAFRGLLQAVEPLRNFLLRRLAAGDQLEHAAHVLSVVGVRLVIELWRAQNLQLGVGQRSAPREVGFPDVEFLTARFAA